MDKVLYIMKGVPNRCVLHPGESIAADGLCRQCTLLVAETFDKIKGDHRFTRKERAVLIHDIHDSLIPETTKAQLIDMILMEPYEDVRCVDCGDPLNEEGYCDDCATFYQDVNLDNINDVESLLGLYEEFMEACIPEYLKLIFMEKYEKKRIIPTACGFCGNNLIEKDAWCQECLKKVDDFFEREGCKWPQITLEVLRDILLFTRMAHIPMEMRIELLREALGKKDLRERDLNPTVFWNTIKEKVKYLELNC